MPIKNLQLLMPFAALLTVNSISYAQESSSKSDWSYNAGFGVMSIPKYPGSGDRKMQATPIFGATDGRYFIGTVDGGPTVPFGLGLFLYKDRDWQAGVAVSYDLYSPRTESDDEAHLHGLGDIQKTEHVTLYGRYNHDWYAATGQLTAAGGGQGIQLKLGASGKYDMTPKLSFSAGPSFTWSSTAYNQTFFGVSATQSANSGLGQYTPTSGISDVTFSLGTSYKLTSQWNLSARLGVSYLPSNISESPIVEKNTAINFGIFTGYRF